MVSSTETQFSRSHNLHRVVAVVAVIIVCSIPTNAVAQRRSSQSELAVDVVRLRSGERLFGAVFGELPDGTVRMAVQRNWLRQSLPEFYRSVAADEAMDQRLMTETLIERERIEPVARLSERSAAAASGAK